MSKRWIRGGAVVLSIVGLLACSDDSSSVDATVDGVVGDGPAPEASPGDGGVPDAVDAGITHPDFGVVIRDPFDKPQDPLAGGAVQSCAVYQAERCEQGTLQRCAVYDPSASAFVDTVDPLFHRALLFDRWYDLYHQPFGITASRHFNTATPVGTAESEWGKSERFSGYGGTGDGAIWTGIALSSYVLRYRLTGTRADYLRMEEKVKRVLSLFDVTGAPGHLAREYYVAFEPGAPRKPEMLQHFRTSDPDADHFPFDPSKVSGLPPEFVTELQDTQGKTWQGQAWVHADPSIDQYSGVVVGLGQALDLLEDNDLKTRIGHHIGCYLKSLVRVEIRNVQDNEMAKEAVQAFFTGGVLDLDPGDMDLSKIDTLVAYASRHLHSENQDTFDRSCQQQIQLQAAPERILDASSPTFLLEMLALVGDMTSTDTPQPNGLGHIYANVRGSNVIQLMYLAVLAWRATGEQQYLEFLNNELLGNWRGLDLADTASALIPSRWCRSWYGDHIVMTPFWGLLTMLGESPVRTRLEATMEEEFWFKRLIELGNAKFDAIYAGELDSSEASGHARAVQRVKDLLAIFGGNGGALDEPRRSYLQTRQWVLDNMPASNETVCPTQQEREFCETGIEFMGMTFEGDSITHECGADVGECTLTDGCAWAMAKDPLPPRLRHFTDYLWQRSPYKFGSHTAVEGQEQSAGLDMSEGFWLARIYGHVTVGQGQVLAWKEEGACN